MYRKRGARRALGMVAIGLVAVLITSCSSGSASTEDAAGETSTTTSSTPPPKPVMLSTGPVDAAVDVQPGVPVVATATDGKITSVSLTNPEGKVVAGQVSPDGLQWTNTEPLGYQKTYTLSVTGEGADGKAVTKTSTFTTVKPRTLTYLSVNPQDGTTVGVGQPLAFYFDEPIADKTAAEAMISITTAPRVEGAFYWFDEKTVHWRPQAYWTPGTKITINAKIYGKHVGNGVYGEEDRVINTTIGDAVVHEADGQTHQVVTKVNGQVVRTMPTSMGDAQNPTPTGTYVLMEKHAHMVMDSRTYGLSLEAGGYVTPVDWAYRMSNSGIFFHSAPWSIGDQGRRNVSHGCLNLSPENAKWVFDNSKQGDIVIVTNSGGPVLESWDGFGDWQIPWDQWIKGNR
ncbi:peptidoglycan transpeptidase precursor (ErfK-YbiS-YhnG family) [Saccharothrix carnea]|uniref:Peptidoglycan transpeptidase (ErfK-YbiS-YhnG family) n=1 Tax=Saccharothrix carnea TaxID=1280637 RepID=A0A2P8IEF6_SACCR|nr:Ig-like domain-containing protein [Saccharothrix carnea]PSL56820.1 peptidoglycan transpeptidase precursor (ErfK-YbiS-YhnG family) [Saccharothrix carnea]